jgi:hypothetical protein
MIDPRILDRGSSWRRALRSCRFPRGDRDPLLIGQEAGWAPEPIWITWRGEKYCSYRDSNSKPLAVKRVLSPYTDCAIPAVFF